MVGATILYYGIAAQHNMHCPRNLLQPSLKLSLKRETDVVGLPCVLRQYGLHQTVGVTTVVEKASHIALENNAEHNTAQHGTRHSTTTVRQPGCRFQSHSLKIFP